MSDGWRTIVEGRGTESSENGALPVEPGTTLAGKYRIDKVIASGGMGVVASGIHVKLSHRIAIKFLRSWTPDGVARFEREARACASIQSEHIARVIDVDVLPNGMPFMVMEFLEGTDLSVVLKERGHLPVAEAVDYVLQACVALAEAHRNGIIHRDLKPANLFLTQRSDGSALVKVLDFGISKIRTSEHANPVEELTTTNALMGSPSYMSPEQLRAARDVDARSDVWGLGAVLYKLVAGHNPFVAQSTPDLCIKILTEPAPPLDDMDLPVGFFTVIERCLEKERDHRYANVAEFAEALRPWAPAGSVERVVRTLGAVAKPAHERTPTRGADGIGADTRLATTVDPSVSDARHTLRSWRAPLVGIALVGSLVGVAWAVVTHKTSPTPVVASETPVVAPETPVPKTNVTPTATMPLPPATTTSISIPKTTTTAVVSLVRPRPGASASASSSRPTASSTPTSTPNEFDRFGERK